MAPQKAPYFYLRLPSLPYPLEKSLSYHRIASCFHPACPRAFTAGWHYCAAAESRGPVPILLDSLPLAHPHSFLCNWFAIKLFCTPCTAGLSKVKTKQILIPQISSVPPCPVVRPRLSCRMSLPVLSSVPACPVACPSLSCRMSMPVLSPGLAGPRVPRPNAAVALPVP